MSCARAPLLAFFALSIASAAARFAEPLTLAPALNATLRRPAPAADSWRDLDLNNVGATLAERLGLPADDAARVVAVSALVYLAVALAAALLSFGADRSCRRAIQNLHIDLVTGLHHTVLGQPIRFFADRRSGELASRFSRDVVETTESLDFTLKAVAEPLLLLLLYSVILVRTDVQLAGLVLLLTLVHVAITRALRRRIATGTAEMLDDESAVAAHIHETIAGIRTVKSAAAEASVQDSLLRHLVAIRPRFLRQNLPRDVEPHARAAANALAAAVVLVTSFHALTTGRLTVSGFVLFVYVARQAVHPFAQLSRGLVEWRRALSAAQSVFALIALPAEPSGRRQAAPLADGITLDGVGFSYEDNPLVLDGVSFTVKRGATTAIVGASGAGKSTLLDLLLGLRRPSQGTVVWDGVEVAAFEPRSYRSHFGVVSQDVILFSGTVAQNIAFGQEPDAVRVAAAARLAEATEFIDRLPRGYETLVGERGAQLSGGERQRIALARAFYNRPSVLLLDEPTSALDGLSERAVQTALQNARQAFAATIVVVAHRLSMVQSADCIVVLEAGRVTAAGAHESLLGKNPSYRRAWQLHQGLPPPPDARPH